jgi:iron complex transport system substrate-binding protein
MIQVKTLISGFLLLWLFQACKAPSQEQTSFNKGKSLITAGGTITEIVYELGFGDQIVGTDITSTYPERMQQLPSIGYRNQIKSEGILSMGGDMVLAEEGYLNQEVVDQLKLSSIEVKLFKKPRKVEETYSLIQELAEYLGVADKGQALKEEVEKDIEVLKTYLQGKQNSPKMAFIMARGSDTVFLAGQDTFADALFELVGADHVSQGFKDFIPLTPEALISMNPEYLLLFESSLVSMGGRQGLASIRGIDQTKAFQEQQILAMDGLYLSGFGPRVGKAALELAKAIY